MLIEHAIGRGQARGDIFHRVLGQDGDAVIAFLSVYGAVIAQRLERLAREAFVHRLDFLQADDIGLGLFQPGQRRLQPRLDGIDVPGGDFQTVKLVPQPQDAVALGLLTLKAWPIRSSVKSISAPARKSSDAGSIRTLAPFFSTTRSSSSWASSSAKLYWNPEQPPPVTATRRADGWASAFRISAILLAARSDRVTGMAVIVSSWGLLQ